MENLLPRVVSWLRRCFCLCVLLTFALEAQADFSHCVCPCPCHDGTVVFATYHASNSRGFPTFRCPPVDPSFIFILTPVPGRVRVPDFPLKTVEGYLLGDFQTLVPS